MEAEKIGTLGDRIANRIVRHFPKCKQSLNTDVPIISFSFDDAPVQAGDIGAKILEEEGARGTFYISGRLASEKPQEFLSAERCRDLAERGHEIACHTYAHRKLRGFRGTTLQEDLQRNEQFLDQIAPSKAARNFAFPYGMASPLHQGLLRKSFRTSRSIMPGINRGSVDLWNLAAVELRPDPYFLSSAETYMTEALKNPGWLIFFTHDVSDDPSFFGCPTDAFRQLVTRAAKSGAKIMSVEQAADYFKLPA